MIVRKIALQGWRNYEFAAAEFSPGTNVITGENAQGKTNLLEAVYLLTGGKSFRTRFDKELIGFGYTGAEVLADVFAFGREQTVRIVLRQGQRKQIWQNGVKKTAAELAGNFAAVLFCPDDLNIIRDGPAARRRMMDMAISQLRPKYGALLAEYSRLYDQKSAILRDWHEKPSLLDTLDDFSDQMCRVSAKLIRYRAAYASRLNIAAAPIHADFSGGRDKLTIAYRTVMPRLGYISQDEKEFFARLDHLMQLAMESLEIKRKVVQKHLDGDLLPYTKTYLPNLEHHFSTIGLVGMNEACLNFLGCSICDPEGAEFSRRVLLHMAEKIKDFQESSGHIYNLEATPAEGTSFRLARLDRKKYPGIICAGTDNPYYTNSTQLPVGYTSDLFEALELQAPLQQLYTGGTVFHSFIGERIDDPELVASLVRRIATNYRIPYFTLTPSFSICPVHGYIPGEHTECPLEAESGSEEPELKMAE